MEVMQYLTSIKGIWKDNIQKENTIALCVE